MTNTTNDFHQMLIALRDSPGRETGRGASAADISRAESSLECVIPEDYKQFLRWFGWGGRDDWEIYGLGDDVPTDLDLATMTAQERNLFRPLLPSALLPLLNDGGSTLYCLQMDAAVRGIAPVVAWSIEDGEDQRPERVSSSFAEWFIDLMA